MIHMHIAIMGSWYDSLMTLGLLKTHISSFLALSMRNIDHENKNLQLSGMNVYKQVLIMLSRLEQRKSSFLRSLSFFKEDPKVVLSIKHVLTHVLPKSRVGKLGILADTRYSYYPESSRNFFNSISVDWFPIQN